MALLNQVAGLLSQDPTQLTFREADAFRTAVGEAGVGSRGVSRKAADFYRNGLTLEQQAARETEMAAESEAQLRSANISGLIRRQFQSATSRGRRQFGTGEQLTLSGFVQSMIGDK